MKAVPIWPDKARVRAPLSTETGKTVHWSLIKEKKKKSNNKGTMVKLNRAVLVQGVSADVFLVQMRLWDGCIQNSALLVIQ